MLFPLPTMYLTKYCIEMDTVVMFYILISFTYCEKLLVEKFTNVEIECPIQPNENENVSWNYEESRSIALGQNVNPELDFKYGISNTFNLQISNFTDADEGRYTCAGVVNENYKQHTVIVKLCDLPDRISYFSNELIKNSSEPETNLICSDDVITPYNNQIYYKAFIHISKLRKPDQDVLFDSNKKLKKWRLREYICLTLNDKQCVIEANTYQLNVEWIPSNETNQTTKLQKENGTKVYVYRCTWDVSYMEDNLDCNETIEMYYSNKNIYLRDFKNCSTGYYECALNDNDAVKIITLSDMELMGFRPVYLLIGVAVSCGMVLVGVLIFGIRKVLNQVKHNGNIIARQDESPDRQAQGYSSIDRRRRIEIGQQVSYTASRALRSSTSKEIENGSVLKQVVSRDAIKNRSSESINGSANFRESPSRNHNVGHHNLNYIEVLFNTNSVGPNICIHGSDNKTSYADIDLTIKADPLPESESSDAEEQDNNSEFLTLADIQKLGNLL